jgi:hypothetical protein
LLFCREWIERYLFLLWPMLLGDVTHKLDVVVVLEGTSFCHVNLPVVMCTKKNQVDKENQLFVRKRHFLVPHLGTALWYRSTHIYRRTPAPQTR